CVPVRASLLPLCASLLSVPSVCNDLRRSHPPTPPHLPPLPSLCTSGCISSPAVRIRVIRSIRVQKPPLLSSAKHPVFPSTFFSVPLWLHLFSGGVHPYYPYHPCAKTSVAIIRQPPCISLHFFLC